MRQVPIPLFGLAFLLAGCGPTIVADFDSPEPAARNSAIVQAAASKDEGAVPDLVRLLEDSGVGVRNSACLGLAGLGPAARDALPALRRALTDPSTSVRQLTQRAIERIAVK